MRTLRIVGPFYDLDKDIWIIRGDVLVGKEQFTCAIETTQDEPTEHEVHVIASIIKGKLGEVPLEEWPITPYKYSSPMIFFDLLEKA